ncbi:glycosyl hydrolase 18 family protein [Pleurotus pulmonarius]
MSTAGLQVAIKNHTTTSHPSPHILYVVQVSTEQEQCQVLRRFSELYELHLSLGDQYNFPPKRSVPNSLLPRAWVDDELIAERKSGLEEYLTNVLNDPKFAGSTKIAKFLSDNKVDAIGDPEMSSFGMLRQVVLQGDAPKDAEAKRPVAAAYYTSWSAWSNPPSKIDFSKFDILFYAFVVPNSSAKISWDSGSQDTLRSLVSSARKSGKGTKIVLSIGGWAGSYWFSNSMSNNDNRQRLANDLIGAVNSFGLDGIDIDWEYPNSEGSGNPHSSKDASNLLTFIKILRSRLGWSKIISAAVPHQPWLGPDARPMRNVSDFAAQMTYNYDVSGGAAPPGPNAPLGNACNKPKFSNANAQAALAFWTASGFPASKLLLGLPLYGYVIKSSATKMSASLVDNVENMGKHLIQGTYKHEGGDNELAPAGDLTHLYGQQIGFNQLVSMRALKRQQDGSYVGDNGYKRGWDNCSSTPFLFNTAKSTFVSYDDPQSLAMKAQFAKQKGFGGCFTWSLDQDDGVALQNAIRKDLGLK